jgi:hypothetical protein
MQIDNFCKSHISRTNNIIDFIEFITEYNFKIFIGFRDIGSKSIHCMLYNNNAWYLADVEELCETLDVNTDTGYTTLHNYCARLLREKINSLYPELCTVKPAKY